MGCELIMDEKERLITTMRLFLSLVVFFTVFNVYLSFSPAFIDSFVSDSLTLWLNNIIVPYGIGLPVLWSIVKNLPIDSAHHQNMKLTKIGFLKLLIIQLGLSVLLSLVVTFILMITGFDSVNSSFDYQGQYILFNLFLLLVFNPVIEEVLFRKIILSRLLKWGERYAILMSSVFFALPHLFSQGLPVMFATFVSGAVWGYATVKTGKITSAVLLHSLSNLFGIFLPIILPQSEAGDLVFIWIRVIILPFFAIGLLIRGRKETDFFH